MASENEGAAGAEAPGRDGMPSPEEVEARLRGTDRVFADGLGMPWAVLLGGEPAKFMPSVVATVLHAGGTRPSWRWKDHGKEYILMAWPKDEPVRAGVLVSGDEGGKLRPVDSFPLLEGLVNELVVERVEPRKDGRGADVGALVEEGRNPMWFFDPLYVRDRDDLTPGVKQPFLVAGLAFAMRKALLDELTITRGPYFEGHKERWLQEHPDCRPLDVPPLKITMTGRRIIMPGNVYGEYQLRAMVEEVAETKLDKMDVKIVYLRFPFQEREALLLPVYASKAVLKDYEPKVGEEVDAYVWLQGRVVDTGDSEHYTVAPVPTGPMPTA